MAEYGEWATSPSELTKDETLAFESQVLRDAHEVWMRQAAGTVPARHQFTPRSVKGFVGNLMIFERHTDGYYIRLMGTRIAGVLGEMQGKPITEAVPPEVVRNWERAFDAVLATPTPQRIVRTVNFDDLHYLEGEILLAPLRDDHGALTMVFVVVAFRTGVTSSRKLGDIIASNNQDHGSQNGQ